MSSGLFNTTEPAGTTELKRELHDAISCVNMVAYHLLLDYFQTLHGSPAQTPRSGPVCERGEK